MQNVGLIGKARSGKDSVAVRLMTAHGFSRVAFADPLREAALHVNPIIGYEPGGFGPLPLHLAYVVRMYGWDPTKERHPEARRFLQQLGQGIRRIDPDYWLRLALAKVDAAAGPVVVSDVRYRNEALALRARGFRLVRVVRPGASAGGNAARHVSETELDDFPHDAVIRNDVDLTALNARVDGYARSLTR